MVNILLWVPNSHLDNMAKIMIEKWSNPPTKVQIQKVIDVCVKESLASEMMMVILHHELNSAYMRNI
jgi:hypothetical protein